VNFLDSFLFRLILGFSTSHLPLRFTGVRHFNWRLLNFLSDIGVIGFIYDLFGVLTIIPGLGLEKNLEESKRVLKDGGNVVIYPEGKIATTEEIGPFKPGAAVLAIGAGAPVILVSFKIEPSRFLRSRLTVNIGEPMKVPTGMGTDNVTKVFRDGILALYVKKDVE
jgi:1-acyl-sn-glycerol-3-phosphate acyltransferase